MSLAAPTLEIWPRFVAAAAVLRWKTTRGYAKPHPRRMLNKSECCAATFFSCDYNGENCFVRQKERGRQENGENILLAQVTFCVRATAIEVRVWPKCLQRKQRREREKQRPESLRRLNVSHAQYIEWLFLSENDLSNDSVPVMDIEQSFDVRQRAENVNDAVKPGLIKRFINIIKNNFSFLWLLTSFVYFFFDVQQFLFEDKDKSCWE